MKNEMRTKNKKQLRATFITSLGLAAFLLTLATLSPASQAQQAKVENTATLQNFSVCTSSCVYPAPYVSGYVVISNSSPLHSLHLVVNGTDEGYRYFNNQFQNFVYYYKGSFSTPTAIAGDKYAIQVTVTFNDNSTSTASVEVTAA